MRAAVEFCNMSVKTIAMFKKSLCSCKTKEKSLNICKPMIKLSTTKYVIKNKALLHNSFFLFFWANSGIKMVSVSLWLKRGWSVAEILKNSTWTIGFDIKRLFSTIFTHVASCLTNFSFLTSYHPCYIPRSTASRPEAIESIVLAISPLFWIRSIKFWCNKSNYWQILSFFRRNCNKALYHWI